jgi:serine/threonine-protein kinase RsbW
VIPKTWFFSRFDVRMSTPTPDPRDESTFRCICVKSTLQDAKLPEKQVLEDVRQCGFCEEAIFAIKLALEEAMTNAVKHGNASDDQKNVTVRFAVDTDRAVILVSDEGPGFDPCDVPDPTDNDRICLPNGRGIMLMRAYMDDVHYRDSGREVYLMKLNRK